MTIQGGHTLDLVLALLGAFTDAAVMGTAQYPQVTIGDDPAPRARTTFDHLLVQARLATGAPLSVEVAGGRRPDDTPFRFEVVGDRGSLVLDGGAARGFQSGRLRLVLNGKVQPVEEGELAGLTDEATNVAGMYAALRDDILNGTSSAPGFDRAMRLTRLVDDLPRSAATGTWAQARTQPKAA